MILPQTYVESILLFNGYFVRFNLVSQLGYQVLELFNQLVLRLIFLDLLLQFLGQASRLDLSSGHLHFHFLAVLEFRFELVNVEF